MTTAASQPASGEKRRTRAPEKVTKEKLLGTERRWRRGKTPVLAGSQPRPDGSLDYGVFGPGSMVWEVLLHPATVFFHNAGQAQFQTTYKPIEAGIRDHEPMSRKARKGKLTFFDSFERASRNAGMHAPMWLGDTETAEHMAAHLKKVHGKVTGDLIDSGEPELGGYDAAGPRESMWAALTEMHPMLWVYEAFAFRDGKLPHRLSDADRDRFVAEVAAYCRLHGAPEDEIPTSMAELNELYRKYARMFRYSDTVDVFPDTGENLWKVIGKSMIDNFDMSQMRPLGMLFIQYILLDLPVSGAMSGKGRRAMGMGPIKSRVAYLASKGVLPVAWLLQRPRVEKFFMRRMWGPDAVGLIEEGRILHAKALAGEIPSARD